MPDPILAAPADWLSLTGTSFFLIALAEFGDKSQLVCMTLASRHRALPVALGAIVAFALLNFLAVMFGAAVAAWLPAWIVTLTVGLLFALFGIAALRFKDEDEDETIVEQPGKSVFATTFLMIFLAEFGDKTQIAVAGLGSTGHGTAVWLGATLALTVTSLLGIYAGQRLLGRLPLTWIHRISGVLFLILALIALLRLISF
ncbi:MAG: TMEM165/GDT1 family protein [Azonexus sp.]|nr:TMEM165/GDT1 family protein [Azonexus sp.]